MMTISKWYFPVLAPAQPCTAAGQCVDNAECSGGTCTCNDTYYADGAKCSPKKGPTEGCNDSAQCTANSGCGAEGVCVCAEGYFAENTTCNLLISAGQPCRSVHICVWCLVCIYISFIP